MWHFKNYIYRNTCRGIFGTTGGDEGPTAACCSNLDLSCITAAQVCNEKIVVPVVADTARLREKAECVVKCIFLFRWVCCIYLNLRGFPFGGSFLRLAGHLFCDQAPLRYSHKLSIPVHIHLFHHTNNNTHQSHLSGDDNHLDRGDNDTFLVY
jgi:hypothetical protein